MTLTEVMGMEGEVGNFTVTLRRHPRYVDMEKCIACGQCTLKCPKKVSDISSGTTEYRKAIFVRYPQAYPLKYRIDPENCIRITKGKCGVCEKVCPAGAILFDDTEKEVSIKVGSMILAPGFRPFDPTTVRAWGYGTLPNVITAVELERYLSRSGAGGNGRMVRPSDGKDARKITFLQCVGSRDYNKCSHGYCSSVCCMFAIKQAMIALNRARGLDITIFFIDMRTFGKGFERYCRQAEEMGIKFRRCRVHTLEPGTGDGDIFIRYVNEEGRQVEDEFDLVVLSVGMEPRGEAVELAGRLGVELNHNRFVSISSFEPVRTMKPGVYACGCFTGPMDIPQSVVEASAAAAMASLPLVDVRHSIANQRDFPEERDISGEEPMIGVFICHCGTNIAGVIDVEELADYVTILPGVVTVERSLFTCSQDTQNTIRQSIAENGLNRVVVAACTPRSHEALFRETLTASGLNGYLFEMANIRNQVSWVHAEDPMKATEKAKDIVRMAVAKAALLEPLPRLSVCVKPWALVIGGGVAGMIAALGIADQGFPVHVVEKSSQLGGNARHLFETWKREYIPDFVDGLIARVRKHSLISVHLSSEVSGADGFVGNFHSTIKRGNESRPITVEHGVTVIATGGQAYKPREYEYEHSRYVLTALEFDKLHQVGDERIKKGRSFVFIQCVGSREPGRMYCSRVCCTHSVLASITLKEEDPERDVYILYRDMRTYGQREELYKKAREMGVIFIRFSLDRKPEVRTYDSEQEVIVRDHILNETLSIPANVVVLATAIVPPADIQNLARTYKLPLDEDMFFMEAHEKLRPVEFANDGVFLAGLAHYPKPMEEAIAQAQAAVSRAVTVLSHRSIGLDSIKAHVDAEYCDGCALCLDVCPYHAISLVESSAGEGRQLVAVNVARCKGCGICQATCPRDGINVAGFTGRQLLAQVRAALGGK